MSALAERPGTAVAQVRELAEGHDLDPAEVERLVNRTRERGSKVLDELRAELWRQALEQRAEVERAVSIVEHRQTQRQVLMDARRALGIERELAAVRIELLTLSEVRARPAPTATPGRVSAARPNGSVPPTTARSVLCEAVSEADLAARAIDRAIEIGEPLRKSLDFAWELIDRVRGRYTPPPAPPPDEELRARLREFTDVPPALLAAFYPRWPADMTRTARTEGGLDPETGRSR